MEIKGQITLTGPQEAVWRVLLDQGALKNAIPGCSELEEVGPDAYQARLTLGVAAVRGSYVARVDVSDRSPPQEYRLRINGSGGPGFVDVDGTVHLSAQGDATTAVDYRFDVKVGGTIAAVGQRVLGGVAKYLMGEFFKGMQREVTARG